MKIKFSGVGEHRETEIDWPEGWPVPPVDAEKGELVRRILHKHWHSLCSAHHKVKRDCSTCARGHWIINRWRAERRARNFRSYRAAAIERSETVDTGEFYQTWIRKGRPDGQHS